MFLAIFHIYVIYLQIFMVLAKNSDFGKKKKKISTITLVASEIPIFGPKKKGWGFTIEKWDKEFSGERVK